MSQSSLPMDRERQHHFRSSTEASCGELVRQYLTETDEQEALVVLREHFWHDQRITSDDVRVVVRAVASHKGAISFPPDFPPTRWILAFKRAHGFAHADDVFAFGLPERAHVGSRTHSSAVRATSSIQMSDGSSDDEKGGGKQPLRRSAAARESETLAQCSMRTMCDSDPQIQHTRRQQQQQQHRSLVVDNYRAGHGSRHKWSNEEISFNASSGSGDSENDTTTGTSSSSSVSAAPSTGSADNNRDGGVSPQYFDPTSSAKRGYKLSHTVSPETWDRAIAAVEQQGMSLRAAARTYGVHFAALHRRVKKRAQGGHSSKGTNGYFHQSDEAGIMRVVVARAELGVLMTFDELMKLVEVAALRKLPDISVANARELMVRFQSRNEQSVRHIIVDWPPSVPTTSLGPVASHHHLEHPGYDYRSKSSPPSTSRKCSRHTVVGGSATEVTVPAAPLHLLLPSSSINGSTSSIISSVNGNQSMLPSLSVGMQYMRPLLSSSNSNLSAYSVAE
ncbi:unnamed protein product [Peronospora farinosa]|nr:unnamed protein product [Peronospora farinosa]